jgi:twitching motility protein PilT
LPSPQDYVPGRDKRPESPRPQRIPLPPSAPPSAAERDYPPALPSKGAAAGAPGLPPIPNFAPPPGRAPAPPADLVHRLGTPGEEEGWFQAPRSPSPGAPAPRPQAAPRKSAAPSAPPAAPASQAPTEAPPEARTEAAPPPKRVEAFETPVNPAAAEHLAAASALAEKLTSTAMSPRHQIEAWLAVMVKSSASDLILRAGGRPSTRVDGRIGFLPGRVPGAGALLEVLEGVMGKDRMQTWRETGSVDAALQLDALGRFRLNAYKQMGEPAVVLRRVADQPPELDKLELPYHELTRVALRKRGLVLVTGVAGSGKSTTLAGLIQYMNQNADRHVITLEDPIEMLFTEKRCVISQREVGIDCPDFQEGLRHALRQSPDVILIGEMRDQETVMAALDASETGHLVLSTMHTVNAAQTLDRILGFFPAGQHSQVRTRLSDNLACVLSQRLLARSSGKGMVPAFELMTSTPRIRELLETGETGEIARVIEMSGSPGLISFNQSLRRLVQQKLVELKDALAASDRPDELVLALRGITSSSGRGRDELKLTPES